MRKTNSLQTNSPVLSIIVPVLNEARTITNALTALKPFRQRGVEVIVVDGGSDDDTAQLAQPLADRVIRGPRGRAAQMNEGAKAASGFIFLFLPSEITLPADADTQVMYGRARDTSVWGRFDMRLTGQHALLPIAARILNWRSRMSGIASSEQAIFIQRETFFRLGGFPDMPVMDDVEMSKRLKAISPPICVASRVTVPARRFDREGFWTTLRMMWLMRFRYRMGMKPAEILKRYGPDRPRKKKASSRGSAPARKRS
ncbi:TIGR04283 family arsenosugar biosynthesis glycosyltransferase [Pseudorhodoplanes sinuspersici]|uniref:Glycosyltransferase 2-like domain-containing protein n=1 Tax=Pseudorhodoplanes sinuspersici TaxID=1235591 RepID=A0A1W6ZU03_9HYPH|nr:TIGR04283 family arsenosugar biosynthesis glycosyltransferase [Pseudorhodoplanes sinuspersici]ARQ00887.1 hypothetical protein CAK95_18670 [Pseudorhodoplanes sinuspersici]RKE72511.1 rSAM/selenodomain-associated transferase 2 [Pseudorhodoplanes sinuspersici]